LFVSQCVSKNFVLMILAVIIFALESFGNSQPLPLLRPATAGLGVTPNASILTSNNAIGSILFHREEEIRYSYGCIVWKIYKRAEIGLFTSTSRSPSNVILSTLGLSFKYKFRRKTAIGISLFGEDMRGIQGFICEDVFLSPQWKVVFGLLFEKWESAMGRDKGFLPYCGLVGRVGNRYSLTLEWREQGRGAKTAYLISFSSQLSGSQISLGFGRIGLGKKPTPILMLTVNGGDNLFAAW